MGDFRDNRRGGGRNFGRRDFGGRFDRPREMTKVICSNCGKETEVPFRPTGDRPVYCKECFAKMGGSEGRRNFGNRNDSFKRSEERQSPTNSEQLREINSKLDQLIKLLAPVEKVKKVEQAPVVEKPTEKKIIVKKKAVKKVVAPAQTPTETPEE